MGPPTSVSESAAVAVALLTPAPSPTSLHGHTLATDLPPGQGVTNPTLRDKPEPLRLLHGFGAVADVELAVQARRVLLDRVRGEEQRAGDLAVGRAAGDRLE